MEVQGIYYESAIVVVEAVAEASSMASVAGKSTQRIPSVRQEQLYR